MAVIDWKEQGAAHIVEWARKVIEANGDRIALNAMGMFDMPKQKEQKVLNCLRLDDRFKFERAQFEEGSKRELKREPVRIVGDHNCWGGGRFRQSEVVRGIDLIERDMMRRPGTVIRPAMWQRPDRLDDAPVMLKQYVGPEATIQRVVDRANTRYMAKDCIEKGQGRYLSGGQATTAYRMRVFVQPKDRYDHLASPDHAAPEYASHFATERCYRVSSKDAAARRVIDTALEHQDDPYAPKVFAVFDMKNGDWASEMELLDRAHDPYWRADESRMLYDWQLGEDWEYTGKLGKVTPSRLLLDKSPFMRAIDKLRVRIGADYDLHGANVMKRGEQIVVLDPLYKC